MRKPRAGRRPLSVSAIATAAVLLVAGGGAVGSADVRTSVSSADVRTSVGSADVRTASVSSTDVRTGHPGYPGDLGSRDGAGWVLSTTDPTSDYAPTFVGNGYLAARVPAAGAGFGTSPIITQSELAGFYAASSPNAGETRASLPTWTTLGFGDGSSVYGASQPHPCGWDELCPAPYGRLSGGTVLASDHTGSTSGQFVAGFATSTLAPNIGASDTITIHDAPAGTAQIAVRYANSTGDTQTGTVTINGTSTQLSLPNLPTWDTWGIATTTATLTTGDNTLTVTTATGDTGRFNLDAIAAYPTNTPTPTKTVPCGWDELCPAPYGRLSGGTVLASDHTGSTSGQFVAGFATSTLAPNIGASDTITIHDAPAGTAQIAVRYANSTGDTQTGTVTINGTSTQLSLPNLPTWDTWGIATTTATLTTGDNTLTLTTATGDTGRFNLDAIAAYPTNTPTPTTVAGSDGSTANYRQSLDMRTGTLSTGYDWTSAAGRTTHLVYTVSANQGRTHQGTVRLALTPAWSGTATVYDQFDGRGLDHATTGRAAVDSTAGTLAEDAVTTGDLVTATLASSLRVDGRTPMTSPTADLSAGTAGQQTALSVQAGHTYEIVKYVGVASSVDTDRDLKTATARQLAVDTAKGAARSGYATSAAQNDAAWAALWQSDISVPGAPALTASVRAAMFYLLESSRPGVTFSASPGGLSSDGYSGHVFWDADTWMYPALLAQHPATADTMNAYRQQRLAAARKIAASAGYAGAKFPWESALTGAESIPPGNPEDRYENHIDSDVALAQWQYYLATGDLNWLRTRAYPVLQGVADYWASRASANGDGSYSINGVQGPDEYHEPVDNEAYTNVSARTALNIAIQAARLVGARPAAAWATVADHLKMPTADPNTGALLEYDGYTAGTQIKQADVTMLQYPWGYPMSQQTQLANLEYYGQNTDVGGPSMTDSVAAVDSAALGAGCSAYTYLLRSSTPFLTSPFDQMRETRTGGAFTFTTAEGGYLQEFLYGFTGMRFGPEAVTLDPSLPPQLPGLDLTGLHWHGRTFDLHLRHGSSTVTVTAGAALPVSYRGKIRLVSRGATSRIGTRELGAPTANDRARCVPATASSADPSYPAVAAVDGAQATAWHATAPGATLTLDLGRNTTLNQITVASDGATTAYLIEASTNGRTWFPVGMQDAASSPVSVLTHQPFVARFLRYAADAQATAKISDISVS